MSTVLIIEDNEKNMKLARDILQAKGFKTVEAVTGEEGVKLAKERKPDLVLMDIQLPGINGIEAFRQIRAEPETARIPVIALTKRFIELHGGEIRLESAPGKGSTFTFTLPVRP